MPPQHWDRLAEDATALDLLRAAQDRSFDCEGIPMFLALGRPHGSLPAVADPGPLAEGRRITAELDAVRGELFPTRRDADLGCLISTIQAVTVRHFPPRPEPLS